MQTLNEQLAAESGGRLQLAFLDLTHIDVEWVLVKLKETEAARKTIDNIWKVNLAGNRNLGDGVMGYLHLLPDTVCDLDLSYCGLSAIGIMNLCNFMKSNSAITRLNLWGNTISDYGAVHIRDMLRMNTTLEEFCCYNDSPMSTYGKLQIADALDCNRTLRKLLLDDCTGSPSDSIVYSKFRTVLERAGSNSAIETLEIGPINRDANIEMWQNTVQKCENLKNFGSNSSGLAYNDNFIYWRSLNMYNARKITRRGDSKEFQSAVELPVKNVNIDVTYFLVRNNVEYIDFD